MSPEPTEHLLVDRCIDAMLQGKDWHEIASGGSAEAQELAEVAAQLLTVARGEPPAGEKRHQAIWRRIAHLIRMPATASRSARASRRREQAANGATAPSLNSHGGGRPWRDADLDLFAIGIWQRGHWLRGEARR
jgi:hypothetical protein